MEKVPGWYVITGGPHSGKTTTVNRLAELGYETSPEYSRLFIDKELEKGRSLEEIRKNAKSYQDALVKVKLELEHKLPKDKDVFIDRGLVDATAYYKFLRTPLLKDLVKLCKNRYKKVFILDILPYKQDYARTETKKHAYKLHRLIKQAYEKLGYKIVRIPVMPIEDRVKMILENIK
ncbi:MAG: ATP-binding protein [Candidatus Aenigmarchaeota archaeon]|nr:ATP-binding protein [Candidatus Aenigmarchaeota archaeon]